MELGNVHEYAKMLLDLYGDKAEVEAAQKTKQFDEEGDVEKFQQWRQIRLAIKEMRGANVS